ncbi:PD40 domain-containing protein [Crocinitomicaceae bacterium CZZ-1]|uniref:PD40 domain-containing protein n=1 Tax=Taishania pollutisoli TaxID=2766479 RepID=A0A8J6P894_9FLAO|nr:OmpA family protein [Taishania pollutisoli]MBC9811896.1 PD40 domain-containing protein [Taishania pollutisoli]
MKYLFFIASVFFVASCSISQTYSTTNKKAIKLFEDALQAPNLTIDPVRRTPNFRAGIDLAEKALEKDPRFVEAHLLAAEYYENYREFDQAIKHYEVALGINPNHSSTGSTYFYLGNAQFLVGNYNGALKNMEIYVANRNANPQMLREANTIMNKADFAIQSMANPSKFNPVNVGPGINTKDPEYFPTITVDGKTILFTRRLKDPNAMMGMQEDFYVSKSKDGKTWETAVPMPGNINTSNNEGAPTISADGRSLIFVACSDETGKDYGPGREGRGSCDLFYTKRLGTKWLDPVNLPGRVNTFSWESQPSLSADGKTLYFVRRVSKPGELPNSDIFVSQLQEDGTWGVAKPLPNTINTPYLEESVLIHPDGKTLYFASQGHVGLGGSDLFVSRMDKNGNWGKAVNLGYPINTQYDENSLMVSPTGEIAFFASDREGGYGDLDIYYFELPESLRPTRTVYFDGTVYDATNRLPLAGKFELLDIETGEQVIVSEADKVTGQFMVSLPVNREYALNVTYPGYLFFSQNFNMTLADNQDAFHMDVPLVPINEEIPVSLNNVFFDLAKATLRPESHVELNKLVDFLVKNPALKIEIGGHTDTRGDDKANLILSQDRANSVVQYLISKGIDAKRLTAKGYGETKTKISDADIADLTSEKEKEAAHQQNRRTEYKIIK